MELKPSKGLKVMVNAHREAIFGDESISINSVTLMEDKRLGIMTGQTLVGYCEVEMHQMDGKRHWYPIEDLAGEHGERVIEEEIPIGLEEEEAEEPA